MTLALLAAGCAGGGESAAEVGDVAYNVDDLHAYLAGSDDAPAALRSDAAAWLTDWVYFAALEAELAGRGVAVTTEHESAAVAELTAADPTFVPGVAGGDVVIRQQAVILAAVEWSESQVPEAPADPAALAPVRYLCSRHILVASEAEARAVLQRLGAEPFEQLAAEMSLDQGSGSVGGNLGCLAEGRLVAPFEAAAYASDPGDVVLAETSFGFHVIEVISSGPATADNHPQLDEQALEFMAAEAGRSAQARADSERRQRQSELLGELQAATLERLSDEVSINDRYGIWDPAQLRVVPEHPS